MPGKTDKWLNLEGIPGIYKDEMKVNTLGISQIYGNENDNNRLKNGSPLPALVAMDESTDVTASPNRTVSDRKANKFHLAKNGEIKEKSSNERYQEVFQGILRRKMKDSWLSTTYQRAIWNARRRLMRGEIFDDLPEDEKHLVTHLVSPRVKPDYSKWSYSKKKYPHGLRLQQMHNIGTDSSTVKDMKDSSRGFQPEHLVRSFAGDASMSDLENRGIQIYPMEFVSLSDRLTLHEPPWLAALRDGSETNDYKQFGLCYGCFHRKGPHYHYQAPVRTGGGFTIYRPHPLAHEEGDQSHAKLETLRWMNQQHRNADETKFGEDVRDENFSNDFTAGLFHVFLENGGDPTALKEYLESNFDPEVLKELEIMGANVELIKDYAEFLREYIRETLAQNLQRQKGIVKVNDREVKIIKRFIEVTSAGGDLEILLAILTDGKNCLKIQEYEKQGGNVELHEHYACKLLEEFTGIDDSLAEMDGESELLTQQKEQKADLIERLRSYIENEIDHKHARLLLEYMTKGGRLDVLVEYVDRGASSPSVINFEAANGDLSLVRQYAEKFPNKAMLLRDIEKFVKDNFRNYTSANLLQKYIENGGKVKVLKQYVRDGCSLSSKSVQNYVKEGGNVRLLQDIGQEFANEKSIREDLEQFPDDPKVVEAYIRGGGSFPRLVRAIADAMGDQLFEKYVKRRTDAIMDDLKIVRITKTKQKISGIQSKSASALLQTNFDPPPNSPEHADIRHTRSRPPIDSHSMLESPNSLANNLLPRLLETARAELKYDKLVATEELLKQNEGAFIAKAVDINQEMLPITSVALTRRDRHLPYSIFQNSDSRDHSTVSVITGERRPRLWKAPPPFTIKKSEIEPTQPQSPFSQHREYDISSLSEDHILRIQKRQRHELDVLRRNYNSKDFRENWRVSIKSPEGSIINEHDSTITAEFEETKPVHLEKSESDAKAKKKDKVSRRERQRAKMKAMKGKPNQGMRSPSAERRKSSASSASTLSIPEVTNKEPAVSFQSREDATPPTIAKNTENSRKKSSVRSQSISRRGSSHARTSNSTPGSRNEQSRELTFDVSSVTMSVEDSPIALEESSPDDEMTEHIRKPAKHIVPPLPMIADTNTDDERVESPSFPTAFGKSTPRTPKSRTPIFPDMIENPNTLMSNRRKSSQVSLPRRTRQRTPKPRPPPETQESMEDEDTAEVAVEDVLKKYCIIREERLPRYRLIFDKHLLLREMRMHERAAKAHRANNVLKGEDNEISLEETYGPAHNELTKLEFLAEVLDQKIDDLEHEITVAHGCLDRSRALTGRELLFKNMALLKTPRKRKGTRSKRSTGRQDVLNEDFSNGKEVMENTETAMGVSQGNKAYDYYQSARPGFESHNSPSTPKMKSPSLTPRPRTASPVPSSLPLEGLSDEQIMNKLDGKTRKLIAKDPAVRHNAAAVSALQDKLKRMKERQQKLGERLEKQIIDTKTEKEAFELEKLRKKRFVRQQSSMYQELHPFEDPVLAIDDIPDALRDVNGELSRADSGVILDALDFPRRGDGVNFRVFCILAALSESALSIQPLVRRLARTRDARALNVKMDRCKEIYDSLLGPNLEILQSELRSNGFTSAQYRQVVMKLTRDEGGLSFLDFVTYVPLFLDIHQRIVTNPLTA